MRGMKDCIYRPAKCFDYNIEKYDVILEKKLWLQYWYIRYVILEKRVSDCIYYIANYTIREWFPYSDGCNTSFCNSWALSHLFYQKTGIKDYFYNIANYETPVRFPFSDGCNTYFCNSCALVMFTVSLFIIQQVLKIVSSKMLTAPPEQAFLPVTGVAFASVTTVLL